MLHSTLHEPTTVSREVLFARLEELTPGTLAVSARKSSSQDAFVRLSGGVVGCVVTADSRSINASHLWDELSKIPSPPPTDGDPLEYFLVLVAVHLG